MSTRVLLHDPGSSAPDAAKSLFDDGFPIVLCDDGEHLLEQVIRGEVDALVYALRPAPDLDHDLGVLGLIRRAAPDLPMVLLAADDSLETHRRVQPLRPIYYAVNPVESKELSDAVNAAVLKSRRDHPRRRAV